MPFFAFRKEVVYMVRAFTRLDLKVIAICSMFLDHGMKLFAHPIKMLLQDMTNSVILTEWIFLFLSGFGRVAFLVFGFQIAQGIRYTHDIQAYWKRLALFALLSEIPYQMMVSWIQTGHVIVRFAFQNVFVTLFFGALACGLFEKMMQQGRANTAKYIVCVCVMTAFLLHTDYSGWGVLYIFLCYRFQKTSYEKKGRLCGMLLIYGLSLPVQYLTLVFSGQMAFSIAARCVAVYLANGFLALAIINHYHGEKGKNVNPYLFYFFYPIHILVLVGVRMVLEEI